MRIVPVAALIAVATAAVGAAVAVAQPRTHYDLYISSHDTGADVYAFTGAGRSAAVEVIGCGSARLMPEPANVVSALRTRSGQNITRITVGAGSGTQIGMCDEHDDADKDEDDEAHHENGDSIVVIEDLTPAQTRRMIREFRAAPAPVRQELLTALAL